MSTYEAISLMIAFGTLVAVILGTKKQPLRRPKHSGYFLITKTKWKSLWLTSLYHYINTIIKKCQWQKTYTQWRIKFLVYVYKSFLWHKNACLVEES